MPECALTDEELGIEELHTVMPDTWKNISWVVQNSVSLLVDRSVIGARALEQLRQYAVETNRNHCNTFMYAYEKGNADQVQFQQQVDSMDKKLHKSLDFYRTTTTASVQELDSKVDKYLTVMLEKMEHLSAKVERMEDAEVLRAFTVSQVAGAKEACMRQTQRVAARADDGLKALISTHLTNGETIGPGSDCQYPTLMAYACENIPKMQKDGKRIE